VLDVGGALHDADPPPQHQFRLLLSGILVGSSILFRNAEVASYHLKAIDRFHRKQALSSLTVKVCNQPEADLVNFLNVGSFDGLQKADLSHSR
jgi:hypothetical protein